MAGSMRIVKGLLKVPGSPKIFLTQGGRLVIPIRMRRKSTNERPRLQQVEAE